ncbi:MAG: hypothetical protein U9R15_13105 [Chloroflexota bacterium]|nr:hypothetical protein [Chloroflexota bacterium]
MNVRKLYAPFALVLGLLGLVGTLILLGVWGSVETSLAQPSATTRYVSSVSGVDMGGCDTDSAPCQTIQYAVGQADPTDDIYIATYEVGAAPPFTTTAVSSSRPRRFTPAC